MTFTAVSSVPSVTASRTRTHRLQSSIAPRRRSNTVSCAPCIALFKCVVDLSVAPTGEITTNTFNWNHLNMDEQQRKWDLMLSRQSKGNCIVCGKALPPSFGTIDAITKFNLRQKVTLSFCIPCMNT